MTHPERAKRRKQIAERARKGEAVEDIATDLGLCVARVCLACNEHRVPYTRNTTRQRPHYRVLQIIAALLGNRKTYAQIAEEHDGISRQAVESICKRAIAAGIPIKRRKVTP